MRFMQLSLGLLLAILTLGAAPLAAEVPAPSKVVPLPREALEGRGLQAIAPYRKELTLAGMQQLSAQELFSGAFVVDVWESQDGGTLLLRDYPFDQYVHVLAGTTTLDSDDGTSSTFGVGDHFVLPRGFSGKWTVSKGFREVLIIESTSLAAGIGRFE